MVKKVVDVKDPVLRQKAKLVQTIDKKIKEIIQDMKDTLAAQNDPEGVGLAAPQIGKSLQIFLMNFEGNERVVINPQIVSMSEIKTLKKVKKGEPLEGCLSLPHYYGPVARAKEITISYQNESGEHKTETFVGFLAHIVQHEIDHLNGVLFVDHILEQDSPLYHMHGDDWEEVELS
jgi:peptide deformylase